jgi:HAE1 family hydrophobic/amphiphilic exporter-1
MSLLPEFQRDPAALQYLYVRSQSGSLVPLSTLARVETGVGPLSVNHSGQLPSVTISFNLAEGVALSQAVSFVDKTARETLPAAVATNFAGTAQVFKASQSSLAGLLVLPYLSSTILGILYESFIIRSPY